MVAKLYTQIFILCWPFIAVFSVCHLLQQNYISEAVQDVD